jgi:hypothetical protein
VAQAEAGCDGLALALLRRSGVHRVPINAPPTAGRWRHGLLKGPRDDHQPDAED